MITVVVRVPAELGGRGRQGEEPGDGVAGAEVVANLSTIETVPHELSRALLNLFQVSIWKVLVKCGIIIV